MYIKNNKGLKKFFVLEKINKRLYDFHLKIKIREKIENEKI